MVASQGSDVTKTGALGLQSCALDPFDSNAMAVRKQVLQCQFVST